MEETSTCDGEVCTWRKTEGSRSEVLITSNFTRWKNVQRPRRAGRGGRASIALDKNTDLPRGKGNLLTSKKKGGTSSESGKGT